MGKAGRQLWLDWQRGLAVVFMVEWHTYDAWVAPALAHGPLNAAAKMLGGLAAPAFLFMAGLSQVLADAALERKGVDPAGRRGHAIRRALWLLGVAYLFRGVEFLLGGAFLKTGGWQSILRVDILNVIAVSLLLSALFAAGAPPRRQTVAAVLATALVAGLTPIVANWPHEPCRLLDYLWGTSPRASFTLFNWAAFAFAGSALARLALGPRRPWLFVALGAVLFGGGWLADLLPPVYALQRFWVTSPSWFAMRLGIVVALSGVLQLLPERADRGLSWLRTMGRHSLLGYIVSVELPYGVLSKPLHDRLPVWGAYVGIVAMIAATWALSLAKDRWDRRRKPGAA